MSKINPDAIDGLLIKVILREASEEEGREVDTWIAATPANRRYFEDFKKIWEDSAKLAVQTTVSEEDAWLRFRERVAAPAAGIRRLPRQRALPWLRIAAIFFVLVAASWFFYTYSYKPSLQISMRSGNATLRDTLEDGTIVTLNKNSMLTAKRYFTGKERVVTLAGEGFFSVAPDKTRPFSVNTNGAVIRVLGTSFNVRNSPTGTEVIVETGQVLVGKDGHFLPGLPNEKIVVTANSLPRKEKNPDELYNYYRSREFVCNGTPLSRLTEVLNDAFDAHIVLADDRLGRLPITTTFPGRSLDEILTIVTKTLSLKMERKDGQITLY